jgi:ubiquitin carboxyl-terminal hydrolase 36/42
MKCQVKSELREKMMDLTVEIDGDISTLDDALRRFTRTEILDGENKYRCGSCKSYERAKKKLKITEPPNVLTIALKRFQVTYIFNEYPVCFCLVLSGFSCFSQFCDT